MRKEFEPAIEALENDLRDLERKVSETMAAINTMCRHAGIPPRYAESDGAKSAKTVTQIRSDTFYGKKMSTAAREYLSMRRAADLGPAKPRDVYEALVKGGFQFGSKDENTALTVLRATMRKNSTTFHRLPDGAYGLLAWYPDAKAAKQENASTPDESSEDEEDATEADISDEDTADEDTDDDEAGDEDKSSAA